MKAIITFLFVLTLSTGTYAQQDKEITARDKFKTDLKNNSLSLYVLGGFAPKITSADKGFQEKFGIKYHDFGCVVPENVEFYKEYNKLVFIHLKKKFGTKWEKDIRKDVIALEEWKPKAAISFRPCARPAAKGNN